MRAPGGATPWTLDGDQHQIDELDACWQATKVKVETSRTTPLEQKPQTHELKRPNDCAPLSVEWVAPFDSST
jgi:hypothetical protein